MIWMLTAFVLAFPMQLNGGDAVLSLEGLQLRGERFSWNGSRLHVEGDVHVDYEDMHIESQHLTLNFNKERALLSLSVVGEVTLQRKGWRGTADKLLWTKNEPWISMHGSAVIADSKWVFQGSRISFSLETDQIECLNDCSIQVQSNP